MQAWNNTDKSEWPRGEWDYEPDKAHWVDKDTGLDCLIVRGPLGALCGYVGVPESNPLFKKEYYDVYKVVDVEVHGGLTFSKLCRPGEDESKGVCHPKNGAANEVAWWIGFDCAHLDDLAPGVGKDSILLQLFDQTYKNFEYVETEIFHLAKQLAEAA